MVKMSDMLVLALEIQKGTIEYKKIDIYPCDDENIWNDLINASYEETNKFLFYLELN